MKSSYIFLVSLALLIFLNMNQIFAQSESDSTKDSIPDFSDMTMVGDEGVVGHELSFQTESDVAPFLKKLNKEFGETDEITRSNDHIWRDLKIEKWHDKPITLIVDVGKMLHSDGSPMGKTWINISIETPDEKMLLKPDTDSYKVIKAYFEKVKDQTL